MISFKKLAALAALAALISASFSVNLAQADEPFIGEVRWFAGNFAPRGWAFCNGQLLPIAQNTALFSILGTTYGGDGRTTFGLPDLQGRVPVHPGNGPGLVSRRLGEKGGTETETLSQNQIPAHTHTMMADVTAAENVPTNNVLGPVRRGYGAAAGDTALNAAAVGDTGGGHSHNNMAPYTGINCIIATQGIFPSRS